MENLLCVHILRVLSLGSVTIAIRSLGNNLLELSFFFWKILSTFINIAFVTDVREFQALLDACVSVRDWEIALTKSIQIPEVMVPMAYARLTDLTLEQIEVRFIFIGSLAPFTSYNIVFSRMISPHFSSLVKTTNLWM